MTMYLYTGTPGSGKSLHAVRDIRDYLKYKKSLVIGNFPIRKNRKWRGQYEYVKNGELRPDLLVSRAVDYWDGRGVQEDRILLVLDECQLLFNARTWNSAGRMDWIEFFTQHRKFGYKIIFITQFDQMIDKQIRALMEYEVTHRKLANFGTFGGVISALMPMKPFIAVTRYYSMKQRLGAQWFVYRKSLSKMYNSYKLFEQANEKPAVMAGNAVLPESNRQVVPLVMPLS